ncbi:MAG: biotin/lipoyl-containing protein [Lachnospiraceae bacterium]|nr:biotin/lipoyl-containing protein [Lachnospiraceae bacterium]
MKNYTITVNGNTYNVTVQEGTAAAPAPAAPAAAGGIKVEAPMSGKILAVKASAGQAVAKGDVLMVLEAMKMENDIVAPEAGTVASINATVGQAVESGDVLATLN